MSVTVLALSCLLIEAGAPDGTCSTGNQQYRGSTAPAGLSNAGRHSLVTPRDRLKALHRDKLDRALHLVASQPHAIHAHLAKLVVKRVLAQS